MRVVAVSNAQPQWVDIRGRRIFTSILHEPSDGPLQFGADGPDDNATAVHTEQVLAFSAQHYDHWTRELGVERSTWNWCHWGENLTIDGLDEASLSVGDRLHVGDACVFEVTSPRIPCFKLAWRIGQPDSVLLQLIQSGKVGIYLRVVTPGAVRAGDAVTVVPAHGGITVADLSRLLIDRDTTDAARLRRILSLPSLGGQASGMLARRAAQLEETQRSLDGRWEGWRDFAVAAIDGEAAQIKSFHLQPVDGGPVPAAQPGQFVTVRLPTGAIRTWSLSRYGGAWRLTIKASSDASAWMHRAGVGTVLSLRAPAGRFVLPHGLLRPVLISAGIGVTPLLAMLQAHAMRKAGPLHWIHSTRSRDTHAFRDEIDRVLRDNPSFTSQVHYTERDGRLTERDVEELLARPYQLAPFGRAIELSGADSDFYICGPRDFEAMVRGALQRGGVGESHINSETFSPHGAPDENEQAQVRFVRSNVEAQWRGGSLLELAEQAGLKPPSGCRVGACQSCAAPIRSGAVRYDPAPFVQVEAGMALLCCARPASAVVEVEI